MCMLVQRIQSTNQIYKPMAKKASQTAQKKLQQVALYGTLAGLAVSEPVNAKNVKRFAGGMSCDDAVQWSIVNPDLYNC